MFTPSDRDRVQGRVLEWAQSDPRVVTAAVVGSLARQPGDRWSDLDLTFAVEDGLPLETLLDDWSERLVREFEAARLFELPSGSVIYRVFLLRGCLQFDLSFSPATQFGAIGPNFRTKEVILRRRCVLRDSRSRTVCYRCSMCLSQAGLEVEVM
jgi:hypothetical protein